MIERSDRSGILARLVLLAALAEPFLSRFRLRLIVGSREGGKGDQREQNRGMAHLGISKAIVKALRDKYTETGGFFPNLEGKSMKRVSEPIVLFDGVCNFCDSSVHFLIDHDSKARLRFAALQSTTGQALLEKFGLRKTDFDTMVLVEGDRYSLRSTAALRIATYLDGWWWLAAGALLIPTFLRDFGYGILARNRYRWFGTLDACRVPTAEVRARFLD